MSKLAVAPGLGAFKRESFNLGGRYRSLRQGGIPADGLGSDSGAVAHKLVGFQIPYQALEGVTKAYGLCLA